MKKILTVPVEYEAIGIENCTAVLLKLKTKENSELQKRATNLIQRFSRFYSTSQEKETSLIFIPRNELFPELRKRVDNLKKSWNGVISAENHRSTMAKLGKVFAKAVKRGIQFRHIVYDFKAEEKISKIEKSLTKTSSWEIKFAPSPNNLSMAILDNRLVILSVEPGRIEGTDFLQTTSPCITELAQSYFDLLWKTASLESNRVIGDETKELT